ncbi:MAG: hypothetical protein V4508_21760 [Pseudomonadota bacterium]
MGVDPFPHLERWLDAVGQQPATLNVYELANSYNKNAVQPPSPRAKALRVFGASTAAPGRKSEVIFQKIDYQTRASARLQPLFDHWLPRYQRKAHTIIKHRSMSPASTCLTQHP